MACNVLSAASEEALRLRARSGRPAAAVAAETRVSPVPAEQDVVSSSSARATATRHS